MYSDYLCIFVPFTFLSFIRQIILKGICFGLVPLVPGECGLCFQGVEGQQHC